VWQAEPVLLLGSIVVPQEWRFTWDVGGPREEDAANYFGKENGEKENGVRTSFDPTIGRASCPVDFMRPWCCNGGAE
jgi:hypothetical protein